MSNPNYNIPVEQVPEWVKEGNRLETLSQRQRELDTKKMYEIIATTTNPKIKHYADIWQNMEHYDTETVRRAVVNLDLLTGLNLMTYNKYDLKILELDDGAEYATYCEDDLSPEERDEIDKATDKLFKK